MSSRSFVVFVSAVLALAVVACRTTAHPSGYVERNVKARTLGSTQLDVLVVDATIVFSQEVERAADRIIAGSPGDFTVRANALRWKTYAISAAFAAGGHGDPAASLLDLWVLCTAQQRFFEEHAAGLFGKSSQVAMDTATGLTQRMARIGDAVTASAEDRAEALDFVQRAAAANPVTDLYFVRKALDPRQVQAFTSEVTGLVNVAHDLQRTVASLQRLLRAHAAILPRQIRWQMELATLDLSALYGVNGERAIHEIQRFQTSLETIAGLNDQIPRVVADERKIVMEAISRERDVTLKQLDAMLRQTQTWASGESSTVQETIARERELVLAALEEQRKAAVAEVEAAADRATDRATARITRAGRKLLRETFFGLLLLWIIILASGTAAVLLLRRRSRKDTAVD